jgi:hypothetical protein
MALTQVDLGTSPTGAGGDTLREAFTTVNAAIADLDVAHTTTKSSAFTIAEADNRGTFTCTGTFAVTFPTGCSVGHSVMLLNVGTGVITPQAGSGASLTPTGIVLDNSTGLPLTGAVFTHEGSGVWRVVGPSAETVCFIVSVSDETTALTTGTGKVRFRAPFAFVLTEVRASVTTAPTGSPLTVDINESGTSVLSTKLTIDAGEKTSTTAATPAVISDDAIADDAELTFDIDGVGSTVAGAGLKVTLFGYRT